MKRISLGTVIAVLFFLILSPIGQAAISIPQVPSQTYVLDQANVLNDETEQTIVQLSTQLQQLTKAQVVVVTLESLNGVALEDYSLAILRGWGIGDEKLNNGLLILVSPSDRVSRIEVGYGLEGALPDAKTGQIQDEYMIPYFENSDFDSGILNGYAAIVKVIAQEYNVELNVSSPQALPVQSTSPWAIIAIIIFIILLLYLDHRFLNSFILGMILGSMFRSGRGGGFGGGGGGFGGGGFGGGSGGGGGSSRGW